MLWLRRRSFLWCGSSDSFGSCLACGITSVALATALFACNQPSSGPTEGSRQNPAAVCTKAGANCEYSPGKIGLCTEKSDGCEGGACLSCMSLH